VAFEKAELAKDIQAFMEGRGRELLQQFYDAQAQGNAPMADLTYGTLMTQLGNIIDKHKPKIQAFERGKGVGTDFQLGIKAGVDASLPQIKADLDRLSAEVIAHSQFNIMGSHPTQDQMKQWVGLQTSKANQMSFVRKLVTEASAGKYGAPGEVGYQNVLNIIAGYEAQLASILGQLDTAEQTINKSALGRSAGTSMLTWIGEQGKELVKLPAGSQVYSHGQSMAMAHQLAPSRSTSSSGDSNTIHIEVGTLVGSDGMDQLAEIISKKQMHDFRTKFRFTTHRSIGA
jgi:hypothetical protein